MDLTTKDLIKIIPFEKSFQDQLYETYDSLSADQRFRIEQMLWSTYYSLFDLKLDQNIQEAFLRAENNEESLDNKFYARARAKTEEDMKQMTHTELTEANLEEAQEELAEIIE